jgi:hypothetical protein
MLLSKLNSYYRHSSNLIILSTISGSIYLLSVDSIRSKQMLSNAPYTSMNAYRATPLYLNEFSMLQTRWCSDKNTGNWLFDIYNYIFNLRYPKILKSHEISMWMFLVFMKNLEDFILVVNESQSKYTKYRKVKTEMEAIQPTVRFPRWFLHFVLAVGPNNDLQLTGAKLEYSYFFKNWIKS